MIIERHLLLVVKKVHHGIQDRIQIVVIPSINYAYIDKKVTVLLQCSLEGNNEFQALGEDSINNYKFQLTHKCACWNGCSSIIK